MTSSNYTLIQLSTLFSEFSSLDLAQTFKEERVLIGISPGDIRSNTFPKMYLCFGSTVFSGSHAGHSLAYGNCARDTSGSQNRGVLSVFSVTVQNATSENRGNPSILCL